jgi:GNAT superfamily N-acetyltransferase
MLTVRILTAADVELVDRHLPLSRLDRHTRDRSTYLVAWDGGEPIGHAHIAWTGTHLGLPEIQDVYVSPGRRRHGVATLLTTAAENEAKARGASRISLCVSAEGNLEARRLYERLGYRDAGVPPVRVSGVITLRGEPFEVDDTLAYLAKQLS